jgi:hypothetical protein
MDQKDGLDAANNHLTRILGFFPRVDAKASVVLAVNTGMLAFFTTHVPPLGVLEWWHLVLASLTIVLLGISLWFLYKGAFPNVKGGKGSLVYFREIAERTEAKFIDEFTKQSAVDHTRDLLAQVWRNSEILKEKFDSLKWAFIFLAFAIPSWATSLIVFSMIPLPARTLTP